MSSPPAPTVPLGEVTSQTPAQTDASPPIEDLTPGTQLGRYLVIDKIGEGGAGAVYAAFDGKLDRKVALKLLTRAGHAQMATLDPGWPRLIKEARMLARLSDPEVVTVFDVVDEGGVGYLAMEYVDGGDLAGWIERHRGGDALEPRSLREALSLMIDAGEGLAAAHAAHVVHGDFKAANVLIDARGRAKVSDFGIARLRAADAFVSSQDMATISRSSQESTRDSPQDSQSWQGAQTIQPVQRTNHRGPRMAGTPAYMAPEQFEGVGADEGTDVYAYCITLFQAVYGALPWRARSLLELATLKSTKPPTKPAGVSVPRWLDALLERGLDADPRQRWPSMRALLNAMRSGMSTRRRGAVALVALLVASTAGGSWALARSGSSTASGALCEHEGFGWDASAQTNVREAFETTGHRRPREAYARVDARLADLQTRWQDAWQDACVAVDSPAIQRGSLRCLERQRAQTEAQIEAWVEAPSKALTPKLVDRAVSAAGGLAAPEDCLDPAVLARAQVPDDAALAAEVATVRTQSDRTLALVRAGRAQDAVEVGTAALSEADRVGFSPAVAEVALALAQAQELQGDLQGAAERLEQAYFRALAADAHDVAAHAAERLVWLVGARLEEHDEGLRWAQHARVEVEKSGGRRDRLMANEAGLLERKGDYARAQAGFEEALAQTPDSDAFARGIVHQRLGDLLRTQGHTDDAVAHYDQTIVLWKEALGPSHPNVSIAQMSRASGLARGGRNEEAAAAFEQSIEDMTNALGETHPNVGAAYVNLGITLKNLGRLEDAMIATRRSMEITAEVFGPEHRKTADRREALGRLLVRLGDGAAALEEHRAAQVVYEEVLEPGHPWRVLNGLNRGDALRLLGRLDEALAVYEAAYRMAEEHVDPEEALIPDAAAFYGRALFEVGEFAKAEIVVERAAAQLATHEGYTDVLAVANFVLARIRGRDPAKRSKAIALAKSTREGLGARPDEVETLDRWLKKYER